jgi:large subunit ribosomal protein L22
MATAESDEKMEFRAQARWVRTAPRKAQLVVSEIRGRSVPEARTMLRFMTRAAAQDVAKVLDSAVANAESHPLSSYDAESLYVAAAYVGDGPTLKRWQARARGRVGRIRKRTCHITVHLAPVPGAVAAPAAAKEPARRGRRQAEGPPAPETPPVETPVAEEAPAVEEPPAAEAAPEKKPARPRRPKAAATPPAEVDVPTPEAPASATAAEEVAAPEEPPKPHRARVRKPPSEAAAEGPAEKPKPARRPRKQIPEEGPEGDS